MQRMLRLIRALELEEKVLHTGVLLCIIGLFFPWLGGQWFGVSEQWNGFGFHTGYIGHAVLILQLYIFSITASPLLSGPVLVRRSQRHSVRLLVGLISTALLIASFTILFRLTSEVSGAQVRFGVYVSIIGSVLATLYAFLQYQEEAKQNSQSIFRHPDALPVVQQRSEEKRLEKPAAPPPPSPPPMDMQNRTLFPPQ
jgi:hypothetical protein